MKCVIVPTEKVFEEYDNVDSLEEAMKLFSTIHMDNNINTYFKAISLEEYEKQVKENNYKAHAEFVTDFMYNELKSSFGMYDASDEEIRNVAEDAYNLYCEGNGQTEYECIEEAYDKWAEEWLDKENKEKDV